MTLDQYLPLAQNGDLAQLVSGAHKHFLVQLKPGDILQTHRGTISHDDLIGIPWGSAIHTHNGNVFYLMIPSLADLITETDRNSQIMYPKDIGYLLIAMGIGAGKTVVEAGTGSGGLTTALAFFVGREGKVISYDQRADMLKQARKNLSKLGLLERVELKQRDIQEGFDEQNVDALFLDVQNPEDYLLQARAALKSGGFFGCIVPTMNQATRMISALEAQHFAFIDVCEIMLRYYRASASRFRPVDRMVAHTGYLIFARPMLASSQ